MSLEKESDPLRRIPTKHTGELRAEIGSILRATRLKRGQTLEAVAQQTRISKRFLEALENDRFEQFPAVVYLRGFLRGYCEHLEVDFDEIWVKLEKAQTAPAEQSSAPTSAAATPAAAPSVIAAPAAHKPAPAPAAPIHAPSDVHDQGGSGATGAIVLAVGLALALALWLAKEQQPAPAPAVSVAPVALQPLPRSIEPKLLIRLKSDAWLRVTVDGQMVFEGRAPRGAAQEWKPTKTVALRTTEPAALELELNGAILPLGAPAPDGEYRIDIP
jgi:cytoskeletal protein RodZ